MFDTIDSTNSYVKRRAENFSADGLLVISDGQTGGRGRMGRSFASPRGEGVYMSFSFGFEKNDLNLVTMLAAAAVCRALKNICGIDASVKWVNDIYYGKKKLCGILAESMVTGGADTRRAPFVCVGVGINTGSVANELKNIAASVFEITGKRPDRNALAAGVVNEFEKFIGEPSGDDEKYAALAEYIGRLI